MTSSTTTVPFSNPPPSPPESNGYASAPRAAVKPQPPHWDQIETCNSAGSLEHMLAMRKKKRKNFTLTGALREWIEAHQIGISINLLLLHALAHIAFPRARRRTRSFFELSYRDAATGTYTQGPDDFFFVAYWIVIFTGLRAATMTHILFPVARSLGIDTRKKQTRFAEQAWLFVYYSIFWTLGMYIMYNTSYWMNLREMWTNFPTRAMDGPLKWYYLVQFAFWLQQIVVVNIEEKRSDHWQMFTHHIVTCTLVLLSYGYYQTKVGNVILCCMDIVDITLPFAKMLKYAGYQTACDFAFGVFIVSWFFARHVLYLLVCWSIYVDVPHTMHYGCYSSVTGEMLPSHENTSSQADAILSNVLQPFTNPGGPVCFNPLIRQAFLGLLLFLQGITIMWFVMIIRVLVRVLSGKGADDSRSDEEDEAEVSEHEDEDTVSGTQELPPLEKTVGVEGLNLKGRTSGSTRYRRGAGRSANGLSLTGHSDKKELLGRIGCDKPS